MAKSIAVATVNPAALISSPDLKVLRRISLGRVQWQGEAPRIYLSGGSTLTAKERDRAIELRGQLEASTTGGDRREQFGLISKMLLTYPVPNASAETGAARGQAYLDAVGDLPAHVIAEAIKRWNRGEAGDHDYRWAPAPAVLRQICRKVLAPIFEAIEDLNRLLSAVSLERAMDPRPIGTESEIPALRRLG